MSKKRLPDKDVETEPLETVGGVPTEGETQAGAEADIAVDPEEPDAVAEHDVVAEHDGVAIALVEPERRRRKRRLIWPLLLASALTVASVAIAQAATLPPLPVATYDADGLVTDAAQAPIDAVVPTAGPLASAKPAPFGPQLEVILPPPPPPPPPAASGGKKSSAQRKAAAAAAASSGLTTAQYCAGKYGATASASSVSGLLTAANAERANFGLAPLSWNSTLATNAQGWSTSMAASQSGNYDLNTQAGRDAVGTQPWLDLVFHHSGGVAENIAFAYGRGTNPAGAHAGWMASPGHCKAILNAGYTQFGAGDAWSSDSGYFATEQFS